MDDLNEFLDFYNKNKNRIKKFLESFEKNNEEKQILGELVFCLCTPQSKAKYCREFVESIKTDNTLFSLSLEDLRKRMNRIRFSDRKAEFIIDARKKFPEIKEKIISGYPDLREWLIKNVKGIGMKESAHFLRNLGFRGVPIIDIHVQNFLRKLGLYDNHKGGLTKKRYLELEKKFLDLAKKLNIPPDELDIAIWLFESEEKEFYG